MGELAAQLAPIFPETRRHYARCLKKLGYPSHKDAEVVRHRRQTRTEDILHVYGPCVDCGLWHLTHKPLSSAQMLAEKAQMLAEIRHYETSVKRLRAMLRPFQRQRDMYHKSLAELDGTILASWELYLRCMDLHVAAYQRAVELHRAEASDARMVRAIDREAVQHLAEHEQLIVTEQRDRDAMREHYRILGRAILNQECPLPAFKGWRQYLRD